MVEGKPDDAQGPDQTSSDDDHFSDASEGKLQSNTEDARSFAAPLTRLERINSQPKHVELPQTIASSQRTQDDVPEEIKVAREGSTSRKYSSQLSDSINSISSPSPRLNTVAAEVKPDIPRYGDIQDTSMDANRREDGRLDAFARTSNASGINLEESPTPFPHRPPTRQPVYIEPNADGDDIDNNEAEVKHELGNRNPAYQSFESGDVGFGDDFDAFESGNVEDDFGAFDEGPQFPAAPTEVLPLPPLLDFDRLETVDEIVAAIQPYFGHIFPDIDNRDLSGISEKSDSNSALLTERSQSLWSQLIAPPPLAPPNWVRSRIRRLFLVSLGVPVDLDEILPASKQKKLILPSVEVESPGSSPNALETRRNGTVGRLKHENNSSTSVNSSGSKVERRRKGPPPPPDLDLNTTRLLCSTTSIALENFTDEELRNYVVQLEELKQRAGEVLEYWLIRKDSAVGEKDAFEEVIENLVKHAKKIRN